MVFNSALCFLLIALALLAGSKGSSPGRRVQVLLGVAVLLFSAAIFSQYLTGADLGLDWAGSRPGAPAYPFTGRMPAPSALGFMLCGLLLALMHRAAGLWSGLAVQLLTALVGLVGVIGIIGHLVPLSLFYRDYLFGQTPLSSACGFVIAGAALWWQWRRHPWYAQRRLIRREDRRITVVGMVALTAAVSLATLGGFVVMVKHVAYLAQNAQMELLRSSQTLFRLNIELRIGRTVLVAEQPALLERLDRAARNAREAAAQEESMRLTAEALLARGFSALEFSDAAGRLLARAGSFAPDAAMAVPLNWQHPVSLLWDEGFVLRSELPLMRDGRRLATLRAEQRLPALTAAMSAEHLLEESGEIGVCGRVDAEFRCFPQRLRTRPYTVPYSPELPMASALAGRAGTMQGRDYRGENVLAAYGPVDELGLGLVVKMDTADLYLPLRENMYLLLGMLALVLAGGGWLFHLNVGPLARRLERSEDRLQQALEGSRIALWDWDFRNGTVYLGEKWAEMLGEPALPMTMRAEKLQAMVHPEDLPVLMEHLQRVLKGSEKSYDLEHRIVLDDGSERWIRSRGKVAERDPSGRVLRMVGTNVDIGRRKEAELLLAHQASHDALTGLPNRLFFKDRLGQAMARAKRQGAPMAVMYMDIDKFKGINDSLGHEAGDLLLREFARRISAVLRTTDTAVRLGGDEFVLILESVGGREDAERVAAKVVAAMQPPFSLGRDTVGITTSGGLALYDGKSEPDSDALLRRADEALYQAKAAGRNNVRIAG